MHQPLVHHCFHFQPPAKQLKLVNWMEYVDINTLGHNRKQNQVLKTILCAEAKFTCDVLSVWPMYQSTKIDGKIIVYVYHYGAIRWRMWLCIRIVFSSVTIITNSRLPDVYSHSSIYRIFYLIFSYFIKKGCTVRQTTSHCQVLTVISDKKAQNVRQITASSLPVTDNDSI